jgi:hypothetical protein
MISLIETIYQFGLVLLFLLLITNGDQSSIALSQFPNTQLYNPLLMLNSDLCIVNQYSEMPLLKYAKTKKKVKNFIALHMTNIKQNFFGV